jgi:peptide/nickel transport system permease protein
VRVNPIEQAAEAFAPAAAPALTPDPATPLAGPEVATPPPWRRMVRRFGHNGSAMAGLVFIVVVVAIALLAPWIAPHDPAAQNTRLINHGPMAHHWLGTDDVGRDILSRLMFGARISLQVSVEVVALAVLMAVPLGLIAGYAGRWADAIIMRVMDALFTFPPLLLALAVAALLGHNLTTISIAISIVFVPGFVRVLRGQVLAVREETFIEASRSVGVTERRMLVRHVLPNVAAPLIVQVAVFFGYALLTETGLSFLGFGVQPPHASWGTMLESAYNFMLDKPWPLIPPGLAIFFTVLAFNLIGDGLRDSLGRETYMAKGVGG